jgi:hypothetical protein
MNKDNPNQNLSEQNKGGTPNEMKNQWNLKKAERQDLEPNLHKDEIFDYKEGDAGNFERDIRSDNRKSNRNLTTEPKHL